MAALKDQHFHLVNLGCAKNLVEGEHLAGLLMAAGWQPEPDPAAARLLIVNTCGFIEPAVNEALDAALELALTKQPGQTLAVVGCLVGRYGKKLASSLPEVDIFISPGELNRLLEHISSPPAGRLAIGPAQGIFGAQHPRALSTGPGWAYLRVADGCPHHCAFCTIPAIRGRLRSRPLDDVVAEAQRLAAAGVRELNLVAQDLTCYGQDRGGPDLAALLAALSAVEGVAWLRALYLHPDYLDQRLIQVMAAAPTVLPYFDLPLQHIADPVLQAMRRRRSGAALRALIAQVRALAPGAVLRTTLLVGHPGEGPDEFAELVEFVRETRLDHLGVFAFSPEPGTRSARLPAPPPGLAQERREEIMALQQSISREKLAGLVGRELPLLVLGPHPESELLWWGRLERQAPEVDGQVIITEGSAAPGSVATCRITAAHDYDLEAALQPA
ncbi:MAG: 30S ribosomal protein S12 methylthiotransferase RimO [Thermodesulfobacteriota bacterium]